MPALSSYEYVIVRVVPRVEREEFVNAGVIVFCEERDFLDARIAFDERRLLALDPSADVDLARRHLEALPLICAGGGPIGDLPKRERWRWLVAPRSTILQTSAPHAGLCEDPSQVIEALLDRAVRVGCRSNMGEK